jgi:hypothetical protein
MPEAITMPQQRVRIQVLEHELCPSSAVGKGTSHMENLYGRALVVLSLPCNETVDEHHMEKGGNSFGRKDSSKPGGL